MKERKERNIENRDKLESEKEMIGVTHKPVLNKKSEQIMKNKDNVPVQDRLLNWHENKQDKRKTLEKDHTPHFTPNKDKV
jgi:hypothetical protein